MNKDAGELAKMAKSFLEIPGESLSDRRVRYWKWKRRQTLTGYSRDLDDRRRVTVQDLAKTMSTIVADLNDVKSALAKLGITVPLSGE
jgi:uncharacterized protein YfaQ (DUF2300 family)